MLGNFIYSKTKSLFLQELEAGNVLDEAIVFIEDTKEIWNHGVYFAGKNIDLTNYETIERSVLRLLEAKTYTDEQIELYHSATLTINLVTGTNWVSFYVQTTLEELQTALGTNGITITTSYGEDVSLVTSTYDSESGVWIGNSTELDFTKMYEITCSADCSITLFGKKVGSIEITLKPGDNWIGFPMSETVSVTDAFAGFEAEQYDVIRSKDKSSAQYKLQYGWDGTLSTLNPGEGYIFENKSGLIKILRFPTESEILELKLSQKQDIISDLDDIREGSALGKTAVNDTINSFDTKVVTLKIHLIEGLCWVSFYVNTTLQELQTALGTNGVSISTTSTGGMSEPDLINTYNSTTNTWSGDITELDFSKMYKIETSSECDIYLTGEQINPADLSISLQTGWNWIGFPLNKEININDIFVPTEGDVFKSKNKTSFYEDGEWFPEIILKPGLGYMFNSVDNKNFTYPDTYYKPFGNVEVSSELGESTTKAASLDLITKVSEESKQYVDDKIDNLNKVTLTIDLVSGYNWVSFYVNTTLEELYSTLGTNGISIGTTSAGGMSEADLVNTYDSSTNSWSSNITELDFSKMYMINVTEADTIEVSGELLNPEDILITLEPGWNNIGYPVNVETRISDAFSGFTPNNGDFIKTKASDFAEYMNGQWLDGGIDMTMEPTKGYQYYNSSSETKTFTFPTELDIALSKKQDKLVSGTNIKTINGESIIGSGDITIESDQIQSDWNETDTTSKAYIANKPPISYTSNEININQGNIKLLSGSCLQFGGIHSLYIGYEQGQPFTFQDEYGTISLKTTGNGTKFLSDNGTYKSISTSYPQVNHGTSDATFALTPNVLHVWDEVTELSLTLADPTDTTVANEYLFQFTSGATATTLTLPDTIKWLETPSIESDKVYQVSILNNCGTILGFV